MFNFSTTTIVNDLATLAVNGKNAALMAALKKNANKVTGFYKAGNAEKKGTATITVPKNIAAKDILRVSVNVRLTNSANSLYANAFVQKGKPFSAEFVAPSATDTEIATEAVKVFNKYQILVCDEAMLKISASNANIVIAATSGHQIFESAVLEKWDATAEEWKVIVNATIDQSEVGFGDYSFIIRNLRVPTGANLRFGHILEDEAPVAGAIYNQYVFTMEVERGIMGGDAMGQIATSRTTHVFWVNQDLTDITDYFTVSDTNKATIKTTASTAILDEEE